MNFTGTHTRTGMYGICQMHTYIQGFESVYVSNGSGTSILKWIRIPKRIQGYDFEQNWKNLILNFVLFYLCLILTKMERLYKKMFVFMSFKKEKRNSHIFFDDSFLN